MCCSIDLPFRPGPGSWTDVWGHTTRLSYRCLRIIVAGPRVWDQCHQTLLIYIRPGYFGLRVVWFGGRFGPQIDNCRQSLHNLPGPFTSAETEIYPYPPVPPGFGGRCFQGFSRVGRPHRQPRGRVRRLVGSSLREGKGNLPSGLRKVLIRF